MNTNNPYFKSLESKRLGAVKTAHIKNKRAAARRSRNMPVQRAKGPKPMEPHVRSVEAEEEQLDLGPIAPSAQTYAMLLDTYFDLAERILGPKRFDIAC
jgi:hypothetical protein